MKFCSFLKILNCYLGQEKSQHDFMFMLFSYVTSEPFSDEEIERDDEDKYYSFSELSSAATSKKVYYGDRALPKALARFAKSHFSPQRLIEEIDNNDETVRENLCKDFAKEGYLCNSENVAEMTSSLFLRFIEAALEEKDYVETGIIAASKETIESSNMVNGDVLYLNEVSGRCPLCGSELMKQVKGDFLRKYCITLIIPKDIDNNEYMAFKRLYDFDGNYDAFKNRIALCTECSLKYLDDPTPDEYRKLYEIKKALLNKGKVQKIMDDSDIESEISDIVKGLVNITDFNTLIPLRMDALRIENKIESQNVLLSFSVTKDVIQYYRYIEDLFSSEEVVKTGIFNIVASELRTFYVKISSSGSFSQEEIFDEIVRWILSNLDVGERHTNAVRIVVSFFVQNCEVFDEVTE